MSIAVDDLPYRMSFDAFLDFEERGSVKHEYLGGIAYAMAGGTIAHNQIALRLASRLLAAAPSHCRVAMSDVLLRTATDAYYPDVMVTCRPLTNTRFETEPCLVVEVVSPSTEQYDRTAKHSAYTNLTSVEAYVLISGDPTQPWIEVHRRAGDLWFRDRLDASDRLSLTCPEVGIEIADLFVDLAGPV